MNAPHRGARRARSRARCMGVTIAVKEEIAPRKRPGCEFPRGTCECAAEVIVGVRVLSRKAWTAAAQDGCNLWGGRATQAGKTFRRRSTAVILSSRVPSVTAILAAPVASTGSVWSIRGFSIGQLSSAGRSSTSNARAVLRRRRLEGRSSSADGSALRAAATNSISASRPRPRRASSAALRQISSSRACRKYGMASGLRNRPRASTMPDRERGSAKRIKMSSTSCVRHLANSRAAAFSTTSSDIRTAGSGMLFFAVIYSMRTLLAPSAPRTSTARSRGRYTTLGLPRKRKAFTAGMATGPHAMS